MKVSVRLFAILRERAGRDAVELDLPDGATVGDALAALRAEPGLGPLLDRMPVGLAVNRDYAAAETPLTADDELALIPPLSGGAAHARVTAEPLSPADVVEHVRHPGAGAIVSFQGTTRDVEALHYEAYAEMAEERIARILAEVSERHGLTGAAAEHRLGRVRREEPSVIVAVSAAHREEAFAGAREAIDRIKAEAPVWKQEVDGGDARWVEGAPPPGAGDRAREPTR